MTILDQNRQILRDSLGLPSKIVIDFRSAEIGVETEVAKGDGLLLRVRSQVAPPAEFE